MPQSYVFSTALRQFRVLAEAMLQKRCRLTTCVEPACTSISSSLERIYCRLGDGDDDDDRLGGTPEMLSR